MWTLTQCEKCYNKEEESAIYGQGEDREDGIIFFPAEQEGFTKEAA